MPQQVREVGAWVSRLDRGQAVGIPVLRLLSQARRRRGRCQAARTRRSANARRQLVAGPSLGSRRAPPWAAARRRRRTVRRRAPSTRPRRAAAPASTAAPASPPSNGPVKVVASKANNSLLIRATPADYERVEATLARLDTAPWQVLIEATIAEVHAERSAALRRAVLPQQGSLAAGFVSAAQTATAAQPASRRASTSCSPRAAATSPSTRCRS